MRERPRDKARLEHILQACDVIVNACHRYKFETIASDPLLYHGLVKHVEIIGEAVNMLSKEFKEQHPVAPWQKIADMRHVLVHDYYCISNSMLRVVVEDEVPELRLIIRELYDNEIDMPSADS